MDRFYALSERLFRELAGGEVLLCGFSGERSDFVRFNRGRVRQAGSVEQGALTLRLVHNRRQASATLAIAGTRADWDLCRDTLARLREALAQLPEDPWLLINEQAQSTASERRGKLPAPQAVVEQVTSAATGHDLAGFYAAGPIQRGFANSLGQRNWHEADSFSFDWSLHGAAGQAVKLSYAGFAWDEEAFRARLQAGAAELELLALPARRIDPGEYRAYLAPRAMEELMGLLSWGGFSARARATRQSPLLKMEHGAALSAQLTLIENTGEGLAPGFQGEGFVKPPAVTLIANGRLADALVAPRSAQEYGLATNGAGAGEAPQSLDMACGTLEEAKVLQALDTGLYLSNLWYLNYSDRPAGRITGMTRFATFWVERGRIAAPVAAMRFDDTLYRMLGEKLEGLTAGRELLLDASTYGERSVCSARLPGALLGGLQFTL